MKSTPGKSRRPVKVRKATTRTKAKAAKLRTQKVTKQRAPKAAKQRAPTAAKQRARKVAKKPSPARKQTAKLKLPKPTKDDGTSKMILRSPADEVERQQEANQQAPVTSDVTVDWGPASHDHTPQELELIVRKLRGGGPHDLKLPRFGTTMRFSTRPLPGSRPAGADISQRVGRTVFFTILSGFR